MKGKKFKVLELLGVVSTVLGIFKGMLMELPFQVWLIIVLSSFTIYWIGREGRVKHENGLAAGSLHEGYKKVIIHV